MARLVFIKTGHRTVRQHYGPPLGILSLASYLRDRFPDLEIKLIDMLAENITADQAARRALEFEPDLVGLSAMSYEAEDLARTAESLKKAKPEIPVVAGGPHATTATDRLMKIPFVDLAVTGEGELVFSELLPRILAGDDDYEDIKGIAFRRNGQVIINPRREDFVDMNSLPLPAFDLVNLEVYWNLPRFGTTYIHKEYAPLLTSRACPYHCTYCHRIFGTRFRAQSPEIVLRDLEILKREFGVREILFVDDCFNLDRQRVIDICKGIVERGLNFSIAFPNGVRGDLMDREVLEHLKAAGTYRITYAVESASPRIQKFIKKNIKLDKLMKVIEMTDALDIMVDGFFMVGFPGESREEVKMTFEYSRKSRLHSASIWYVTPFPGTELYGQARELGYEVPEITDAFHYNDPRTDLSEVPYRELKRMVKINFIRFYLNPRRLYRIIKLYPNKRHFLSLFKRLLEILLK